MISTILDICEIISHAKSCCNPFDLLYFPLVAIKSPFQSIVEHINLDGNEIMGSIPKELEDLTNLGMFLVLIVAKTTIGYAHGYKYNLLILSNSIFRLRLPYLM